MKNTEVSGVIRLKKQGPSTVLEYTQETLGEPGENEVLLKQEAIAVNFVDVMFRNGTFPLNHFPVTIGVEAVGTIEQVGHGAEDFNIGDRVGYYFSLGAYAARRLVSTRDLIRIPDDISFDQAASLLAKGLTARMLVKQAYQVKPDDVVLVHAAAGGVGSLVAKWAKSIGATVIGTVGNVSKKDLALGYGLDHVVALDSENLEEVILAVTNNQGVDVVYDGVGKATFEKTIPVISGGGTVVLYGTASGEPQIDSANLNSRHIRLMRPSTGQYINSKKVLEDASEDLFEAVRSGALGEINPTIYPLAEAGRAHQDLEASKTTGSLVLHP